MVWLILIACLAAIFSIVFAVITLVKKIQKKECKRPWTLCRISFGACFASLLIGISSGSWNILPILVAILLILYGIFHRRHNRIGRACRAEDIHPFFK